MLLGAAGGVWVRVAEAVSEAVAVMVGVGEVVEVGVTGAVGVLLLGSAGLGTAAPEAKKEPTTAAAGRKVQVPVPPAKRWV